MKRLLFLATAVLLLAGCATRTQPQESHESGVVVSTGDYTDEQLGENQFRVTFRGNAALSDTAASDLNLLHAAEVTLKNGYRYFLIVVPDPRRARNSSRFTNYVFTSAPSLAHASGELGSFPIAVSIIECFKDKLTTSYGKVFDAEALAETLRARYGVK